MIHVIHVKMRNHAQLVHLVLSQVNCIIFASNVQAMNLSRETHVSHVASIVSNVILVLINVLIAAKTLSYKAGYAYVKMVSLWTQTIKLAKLVMKLALPVLKKESAQHVPTDLSLVTLFA